jgi:transposase
LNRVRSSRRLEAETRRNLEIMWLLRGLTPDFKTIADFRKDNRDAFVLSIRCRLPQWQSPTIREIKASAS